MTRSSMLTIQYLEDSPNLSQLNASLVIDRLRAAADSLKFTHLLVGWHLPSSLLEACRLEAERLGVRFMGWQPLITCDKDFQPDNIWLTEGLKGHKVAGYRGLPEFTFNCPNHPAVQESVLKHIDNLIHRGVYQGFFLDRVRFPSPAIDPLNDLACFCEHCRHKAAKDDLDLDQIRSDILHETQEESGCLSLVKSLLSGKPDSAHPEQSLGISQFLNFRMKSMLDFLAFVTQPIREANLEIGLDCFSPCLTPMVGQDLSNLSKLVDWIKLMTYAHTLGPAGIPYELSGLLQFLSKATHYNEGQVLACMGESIGLPLPISRESLEKDGLSTFALEIEVKRGIEVCSVPVLAGIELVDLAGVTSLYPGQIRADLRAVKHAGAAGLAISWDLLHIPPDRWELVRQAYLGNK